MTVEKRNRNQQNMKRHLRENSKHGRHEIQCIHNGGTKEEK